MVAPHWTNSPSLRLIQNWWRKVMPPLSLWMMAREPRWFSSPISQLRGWYTWQSTGVRAKKVNKVQQAWILLDCMLNYSLNFDVYSNKILECIEVAHSKLVSPTRNGCSAAATDCALFLSAATNQDIPSIFHTYLRTMNRQSLGFYTLIQFGATW